MRLSMKCSVAAHCLIFIHEYGASAKVTSELLALSGDDSQYRQRSEKGGHG